MERGSSQRGTQKFFHFHVPSRLYLLYGSQGVPGLVKACAYFTGKALGFTYEKVSKTATSIVVTTTVHTLGLQHFSNLTKYLPWSKIEIPLLVT